MRATNHRRLVFQPGSYRSIRSGADQLVDTIRPTLGPFPRIVAVDRVFDQRMPELLDNGGVIAKRIIQLPDPYADIGAMYVRDFLWQLQDQEGDGTATAAVLFQAVFNAGVRQVASGLNARRLQSFIEEGLRVILAELTRATLPVSGKRQLAHVAHTVCHDAELSDLLGEIFDIAGEYGRVEIRKGRGRGLEREYVEGIDWDKGLASREMIADRARVRTELENAAIVVSDLDIHEPEELLPVLTCALQADAESGSSPRHLVIIANSISDRAVSFLLANNRKPQEFQVIAVKTPGYSAEEQAWFLTDATALCGGRAFVKGAGDTFKAIRSEHLGRARRVWADYEHFGIVGGRGDPRRLRQHLAGLRSAYTTTLDIVPRDKLHARVGKLLGGSATLRIGGVSELEIEERKEQAERTAAAVRGALREGIVPGGGTALLSCREALRACLRRAATVEETAAYRILIDAVAEPLRTIAANAGYDPSDILAEVRQAGPGYGFDALAGKVVPIAEAGIFDPASVQKAAVYAGIGGAALALSIDVLVHRREQPSRATPRLPGKRKQL